MKVYNTDKIKNVVLLGHSGCGKTTLAETMLFETGAITRRGSVEDKNTVSDYSDLEHERQNSVTSSILALEWREGKLNLIDAPGNDEFVGETIAALKVCETAIMVLNAQSGIEVGSIMGWRYATAANRPVVVAVNQLDHEKADFEKTLDAARAEFGNKVTIMQYPLNQGTGFDSIIDVLKMVMYKFPATGGKPEKLEIPESEKAKADELHNALVETAAENDEALMELYFEEGSLTEDQMREGLRIGLANCDFVPVFCVSAKHNMGTGRMMGFIQNVAPGPADVGPTELEEGELACDANGDPVLFVFKTISEPHLGEMSLFKVCSGKVATGNDLSNAQTRGTERFSQLNILRGKSRDTVDELVAGDIGAAIKLKDSHTNNTLHAKGKEVIVKAIDFPEPLMTMAVSPTKKGDEEKMMQALHILQALDPTLVTEQSKELKQILVHSQGEIHMMKLKWLASNIYKVDIELVKPKIAYRETIQKSIDVSYKHKKQSGGSGQFAEVYMRVEPYTEGMPPPSEFNTRGEDIIDLEWGGKLAYLNCIVGGAIDTRFLPAILKGVMEKMHDGPLTGSYVRDVRVSIFDGKMHAVDSNDMAFKLAGLQCFRDAFHQGDAMILEPIYEISVLVPEEIMGDVMSDLQTRRATIMGMEVAGNFQRINAKVPLAELHKYSSTLRSISQGMGKHSQKFAEYARVPFDLQQKLIAEHNQELAEV